MLESIRKTILTGIGAAVVTREKVQGAFDELIAQGKVTAEDARVMAEQISAEGKREFEAASEKASQQLHHLVNKGSEVTNQKLAELEARLKAMEYRASQATKPKKKAAPQPVRKVKVAVKVAKVKVDKKKRK